MPLSIPQGRVTPEQFDAILAHGYRRSGWYFYRTRCHECSACEPLRIEVSHFQESRSMRRARKLGDEHLRLEVAQPMLDEDRLRVFNLHRSVRKLDHGDAAADAFEYSSFLLESHCDGLEFSFWHQEKLVAVSIMDVGSDSLSAVYCYFDPEYSWLSPGTYSILCQVSYARRESYKWLYLGMFVEGNSHLCYKARFGPHERLQSGQWKLFPPQVVDRTQAEKTTPNANRDSRIEYE